MAHSHVYRHEGHAGEACSATADGKAMKQVHTKDLLVREDVMAKAKEIADLLSSSEEAVMYRKAEQRVQQHEDIQRLIASIKKKQKEIVAFETTFKNEAMVKKIEKEIDELQDQLDEYPIVTQFRQTQSDLNYVLQLVFNVIRDSLADKITLEDAKEAASSAEESCE